MSQADPSNKVELPKEILDAKIEQYKLAVQMADNISQRRGTANSFYITMLTLLIAVITAFFSNNTMFVCVLSALGILVSISWIVLIKSYKNINTVKFTVINKMEEELPFSPFKDEWALLTENNQSKHHLLTNVECIVPIVFIIVFALLFILTLLGVPNIVTVAS